MESLYFLIPLSIVVVALGIWLFFWAVNSGQYDDLDGEGERILFDELDVSAKAKGGATQQAECRAKEKPGQNRLNKEND